VEIDEQQQSQYGTKQKTTRARRTARLLIVGGEPDLEALTSVIDEWLVPLLVKEFLAIHPFSTQKSEVNSDMRTTPVLVKEGAVSRRVQKP
jgi:hypothetical protein